MGRFVNHHVSQTEPDLDGGGEDLDGEIDQNPDLDGGGDDLDGEIEQNPIFRWGRQGFTWGDVA